MKGKPRNMKLYRTLFAALLLSLLLVPLIALPNRGGDEAGPSGGPPAESAATEPPQAAQTVRVLLSETNRVVTVAPEEYLTGVLACEMSPTFHEEALKAQAAVSHTFLLRRQSEQAASPDPALAELEATLLREANSLGIGPMGLGGRTPLLGLKIGSASRLPASFFVTVAYICWACRRGTLTIEAYERLVEAER